MVVEKWIMVMGVSSAKAVKVRMRVWFTVEMIVWSEDPPRVSWWLLTSGTELKEVLGSSAPTSVQIGSGY